MNKENVSGIIKALEEIYPEAICALEHENSAWKLFVMARLSAQCTDARVNIVSKELFKKYPDASSTAKAELEDIESIVRPCGLYKTKAKNIKDSAIIITEKYGGEIPSEMDELLELPGVGRKIANLIRGDLYGMPAIVTDTHCIRICGRLGFYDEALKDPYKIECILKNEIPDEKQSDFCHRIVMFGREYCMARNPACEKCPISSLCCKNSKQDNTKTKGENT